MLHNLVFSSKYQTLLTRSDSLHTLFLQPELWHKQSFSSWVNRQDKTGALPLSQIEILFLKLLGYWMCQGWYLWSHWSLGHWLLSKGCCSRVVFHKVGRNAVAVSCVLWVCSSHTVTDMRSGCPGVVASQGSGAVLLTVQNLLMILLTWTGWGWMKSEVWSTSNSGMQTLGDGFKGSFNAKHCVTQIFSLKISALMG